jgi:hypothetical protein
MESKYFLNMFTSNFKVSSRCGKSCCLITADSK